MWSARSLPHSFGLLFSFVATLLLVFLQPASLHPLQSDLILINEIDASTPGTDTAEFVELYDGGAGSTNLDGLILVFFNGQDDRSYRSFDLAGYQTDADGYFLVGNQSVSGVDLSFADNVLQDGPDAVALYLGDGTNFPNGTAVITADLQDAIVYDSDDPDDPGLLALLLPGQPQVDEDSLTLADFHSSQRCPDGSGGARQTGSYIQELPTPKRPNRCPASHDTAPSVAGTAPSPAATGVPPEANITINFSEQVSVAGEWFQIACSLSGNHAAGVSGDGISFTLDPTVDFAREETCSVTLFAAQITDLDSQDPPDHMTADYRWSFATASAPAAGHILINEVDADTPSTDTAEFIELYDGGTGAIRLDGLVVVLFNGSSDSSYRAIDLDGQVTSSQGYFVLGSSAVTGVDLIMPDGVIQNGPDAIALFEGSAEDFPSGSPVTIAGLRDAIVYDTGDPDDGGLLALLKDGQPQVNEANRSQPAVDSNQRCPNGAGEGRETQSFLQNLPTPGAANKCSFDAPPAVVTTSPADGQDNVAQNVSLTIRFSEGVRLDAGAVQLACSKSGAHTLAVAGGPSQFTAAPGVALDAGETCTAAVMAAKVRDQDLDDPPDHMDQDYDWSFNIKELSVDTEILINELDADTDGADRAEFVELFNGGRGSTPLDGLVLVLFNGFDDRSYRAVDLDGYQTDAAGYFVAGGGDVPGVDLPLADSTLQNGADAVALYASDGGDFPNGSPVTLNGLVDALVYDTDDDDDHGLLVLLQDGQPQVNESSRGSSELDASQRCPNGAGGQRFSSGFLQNPPTPGAANNCAVEAAFGNCGDPATPIHLLQGSGLVSPLNGAQDIVVEGIVVASFQGSERLQGFFIQSKEGEADGDPLTSEGLFIFTPDFDQNMNAGEVVRLQGSVNEVDGQTTLDDLSEMSQCGSAPLPAPVELTLPLPEAGDWEHVEGMRLSLPQALFVTGSAQMITSGILDLSAGDRLYAPTSVTTPGDPALAIDRLNRRSRILLDDGSNLQHLTTLPPYLGSAGTVRVGDRVRGLVGILAESEGSYRIHPSEAVSIAHLNNRPTALARPDGSVRVALLDTGGYFNGDGLGTGFPGPFGAESAAEFARQREKILSALLGMDFDIVGLLSIENDPFDANGAIQDLASKLNETTVSGAPFASIRPTLPEIGAGGTALGVIYRSDRVIPAGAVEVIEDIPPEYPATIALIQRFTAVNNDRSFLLAFTAFPGRDTCPPAGDPNADQGDGQACWNAERIRAAETVAEYLAAPSPDAGQLEGSLLLGNLNAYANEDPLAALADAGYANLAPPGSNGSYTAVIDGQTGALLHAFTSPAMDPLIMDAFSWHINADEPPALDYRLTNPPVLFTPSAYRSTPQDPLLVDICLDADLCHPKATYLPVVLGD